MKTQFQNGTIVTPAFLNAMANAACKKTPSNDGDVKSPTFDELADAGWLTKAIVQELFSSLGLNPGDHEGDPITGAVLAAVLRAFGTSQSERLAYIGKWKGMINTLNGDPADFCMDLRSDVNSLDDRVDAAEHGVATLYNRVDAVSTRVSSLETSSESMASSVETLTDWFSSVSTSVMLSVLGAVSSLQLSAGSASRILYKGNLEPGTYLASGVINVNGFPSTMCGEEYDAEIQCDRHANLPKAMLSPVRGIAIGTILSIPIPATLIQVVSAGSEIALSVAAPSTFVGGGTRTAWGHLHAVRLF